jgi:hypothetical protein
MLNILSLLIGALGLLLAVPALIPFLGWANWFVLPVAAVGIALGVLSRRKSGRNLNIAVMIIAAGRLMLGGGIF